MAEAHLDAVGIVPFGRRQEDLLELAAQAVDDLTARSGTAPRPDHLIVTCQEPGAFAAVGNSATAIADAVGLAGVAATRVEAAPASGLAGLEVAAALVASGRRREILLLGVETMGTVATEEANRVLAQMAAPHERRHGLSMAAEVALMTRAYLERFGLDPTALDAAAAKAHAQGALNPLAHFQDPVSAEAIARSPMVADPLRRHHSAPLSDGAACCVVRRDEGPVRVAAVGHATDHLALTHRTDAAAVTHFQATRAAAAEAFARAGRRPGEVGVAEVHDAFASMEGIHLEDLGFAPLGEGLRWVAEGRTRPTGAHPTNCSGGLKARGHPVGATGVAQLIELYWQLTEDPEVRRRQARDPMGAVPRVGLGHNMGGLGNNVVVALLEAVA